MAIDTTAWRDDVRAIYAAQAASKMPLRRPMAIHEGADTVRRNSAADSFGPAKSALGLQAGLLLHLGAWSDAHDVAQALETPEGSYWHAIIHRLEPDAWNSMYWFRRVGQHPVFSELLRRAEAAILENGVSSSPFRKSWDPEAFISFCETAQEQPGSGLERAALQIQQAEWELLMEWCQGA